MKETEEEREKNKGRGEADWRDGETEKQPVKQRMTPTKQQKVRGQV